MRGANLSVKSKWPIGRIALLAALIIGAVAFASGCISGITAVGWSGGTVSDNTIYVGSQEGRLVALNLADDSRRWSEPIKANAQTGLFGCSPGAAGCGAASAGVAIYGTPVVSGELVYIAGYNGKIYAYATSTLAARWVYPREGYFKPFVGGLVIDQGRLYVGCSDGKVYALDAATGDPLWKSPFATGDKVWSTPAISGGTLYVGSFDKKLYAINTADGSKKWEFPTEGAIMAAPLIYKDTVYFGSLDRNFYALNAADGGLKWKITADNWFWAEPVVVNDTIYAGCLDGSVYVLKATDGARVAIIDLKAPVSSKPVIVDSSVIFATRKGVIYSIDTVSNQAGQLADFDMVVNGPLTANEGIVYIHAQDIALQRVNAVNGSILPPVSLIKPD
jgi:outer membrane protein assembly factor BamB